jgi:hypothetical protein
MSFVLIQTMTYNTNLKELKLQYINRLKESIKQLWTKACEEKNYDLIKFLGYYLPRECSIEGLSDDIIIYVNKGDRQPFNESSLFSLWKRVLTEGSIMITEELYDAGVIYGTNMVEELINIIFNETGNDPYKSKINADVLKFWIKHFELSVLHLNDLDKEKFYNWFARFASGKLDIDLIGLGESALLLPRNKNFDISSVICDKPEEDVLNFMKYLHENGYNINAGNNIENCAQTCAQKGLTKIFDWIVENFGNIKQCRLLNWAIDHSTMFTRILYAENSDTSDEYLESMITSNSNINNLNQLQNYRAIIVKLMERGVYMDNICKMLVEQHMNWRPSDEIKNHIEDIVEFIIINGKFIDYGIIHEKIDKSKMNNRELLMRLIMQLSEGYKL